MPEPITPTPAAPAAPATGAPEPAPAPAAPAEPPAASDPAAEVEKWKALARKHEERATANAEKAKRLDALEEATKTEQQKLTEAAETARKEAADTAAELARMKAAVKHGLSEADLVFLRGPAEEIDALAENLAARLKGIVPPPIPPAPPATALGDVGGGVHGNADPIKELDAQIAEAEKSRKFALAIQLKQQRAALAAPKH